MFPTFEQCQYEVQAGRIEGIVSPCGNYMLFDYLPIMAAREEEWNEVNIWCRGLVFDIHTKQLANFPLKKFFNLGQLKENSLGNLLNKQIRSVAEKVDGSLGICWWNRYTNQPIVHTRGSFRSDQAVWATAWLQEHMDTNLAADLLGGKTYLFEIIYPENRIVCNYGGWQGLVCLGVHSRHEDTLVYQEPNLSLEGFRNTMLYPASSLDALAKEVSQWKADREGVVVLFTDGTRVKLKSEEYLKIHRLRFGMNHNRIVENLKAGNSPVQMLLAEGMPDEFVQEVREVEQEIWRKIHILEDETSQNLKDMKIALGTLDNLDPKEERKQQALWAKAHLTDNQLRRFFSALEGHYAQMFLTCLKQIEVPPVNRLKIRPNA